MCNQSLEAFESRYIHIYKYNIYILTHIYIHNTQIYFFLFIIYYSVTLRALMAVLEGPPDRMPIEPLGAQVTLPLATAPSFPLSFVPLLEQKKTHRSSHFRSLCLLF